MHKPILRSRLKIYVAMSVILLVFAISNFLVVNAQDQQIQDKTKDKTSCEYLISYVNYRSKLLGQYLKVKEKSYNNERAIWVKRIQYSSQWTPKDAEKSKDNLIKLDSLHKDLVNEVNKQIGEYKYLEEAPLDCTDQKRQEAQNKIIETRGSDPKKTSGKQKEVEDKARAVTKFQDSNFKKSSEKMIKSMRKVKQKNPQPLHDKISI